MCNHSFIYSHIIARKRYIIKTEGNVKGHEILISDYAASIQKVSASEPNGDCPEISKANVTKMISTNNNDTKDLPPSLLVTKGVNKFGGMLFKDLEKSTNLVFSPFSLSTALVMLTPGARGNTRKQVLVSWYIRDSGCPSRNFEPGPKSKLLLAPQSGAHRITPHRDFHPTHPFTY